MNTLVVMEIFHLSFIRHIYGTSLTWKAARGTPVMWMTIAIVTLAQFAITFMPLLQKPFATVAISIIDGVLIVVVGITSLVVIEIEKQLWLRLYLQAGW